MEFFKNGKSVRLRSVHEKYLYADQDQESVRQNRDGASANARWTIEVVDEITRVIRLKSFYERYLTASNKRLAFIGCRVLQTLPDQLDSTVEWEPIREEFRVTLKTRHGGFLRANGGLPPWRNTVTHDIPNKTITQNWVLWEVRPVEIPMPPLSPLWFSHADRYLQTQMSDASSHDDERVDDSENPVSGRIHDVEILKRTEPESPPSLPKSPSSKTNGRVMYYYLLTDEHSVVDDTVEWPSFTFRGIDLNELKQKVEEETGLHDVIICRRNPITGGFYPLRLQLPPNNSAMRIFLIKSSSTLAKDLSYSAGG